MGRLLSISQTNNLRNNFQKGTYSSSIKVGSVSLTFITIILICLLSLLYLAFSNQLSSRGYELRKLEERKQQLSEENERMEVEASRLQSIKEIEANLKESKMVPQNQVNYTTSNSSLANK